MANQITKLKTPCLPKFCMLGIYPSEFINKKSDHTLIDLCLLQAKRAIAIGWENVNKPSINQYIQDLSTCVAMEKLTYITKRKLEVFDNIWGSFMEFLNQKVGNNQ